ncbi:hypothetical protein C1N71_13235 [Agrococcus sp. SGAir0287]|nr:hypothetical protein C1N71_13235 [Agrococcus sp. SGAir0287]
MHSLWMLPGVVGVGLATWMGFLFIGVRAKRRLWVVFGVAYFVAGCAVIAISSAFPTGTKEEPVPENAWSGWVTLGLWVLGIAHTILTNKAWLKARAHLDATSPAVTTVQEDTAPGAGDSGPVALASEPASADLNSASVESLLAAGLHRDEADAVVAARAQEPFAQASAVVTRAVLQPHRFAELRGRLVADVEPPDAAPRPASGRRLDL